MNNSDTKQSQNSKQKSDSTQTLNSNKHQNINQNNNKKNNSIKKNYFYNLTYTLLNSLLPLLTAPYLSRIIGVKGIGTYAYYYSIAHIFFLFAKLGMTNYGTRKIAKARALDDKEDLSYTFSSLYYQQLLTTILASVIYFCYFLIFEDNVSNRLYSVIFGTILFAAFFDIDWLYSGLENFKSLSLKNIFVKCFTVICIFIFVRDEHDLIVYIALMCAGTFFGYVSLWIGAGKYIHFCKVPMKEVLSNIAPNALLLVPLLAVSVYRTMDKIMLGAMTNTTETGLYENAEKIIYTLCGFINSFGTVMMPKTSNLISSGNTKKSKRYLLLSVEFMSMLLCSFAFGLSAISDNLSVFFFGEDFKKSGILMSALAFTLIPIGLSNIIRTQYIIPHGLDKIYLKTVSTGAVINLIVNFIFIPKYGAVGAVIGTICAEFSIPFVQYLQLRKQINYKLVVRKTGFYPVIGLIMYIIIRFSKHALHFNYITEMFIEILLGIFIYTGLSFLYVKKYHSGLYEYTLKIIRKSMNHIKQR